MLAETREDDSVLSQHRARYLGMHSVETEQANKNYDQNQQHCFFFCSPSPLSSLAILNLFLEERYSRLRGGI